LLMLVFDTKTGMLGPMANVRAPSKYRQL